MPISRSSIVLLILSALLALSSCSKSEYWVKGLTLPPGSTVVDQLEQDGEIAARLHSVPSLGETDRVLIVEFNCTSGWSEVSAYFDSCLVEAGYAEAPNLVEDMVGSFLVTEAMTEFIRMYTSPNSDCFVAVKDAKAVYDELGWKVDDRMGNYGLTIGEIKQ